MPKTKKPAPLITEEEVRDMEDAFSANFYMVPIELDDPRMCPNCGGDKDNGDHTICQNW